MTIAVDLRDHDRQPDGPEHHDDLRRLVEAVEIEPAPEPDLSALLERAEADGDEELVWRIRLAAAERAGHAGGQVQAVQTARAALRWAGIEPDRGYVAARAHRGIALLLRHHAVGDQLTAVEHAEQAIALLPPTASAAIRFDHLLSLGDALAAAGMHEEAEGRYHQALALADPTSDVDRPTDRRLAALTHLARQAFDRGHLAGALRHVRRIEAEPRCGVDAWTLTTIGEVHLAAGHPVAAEAALLRAAQPTGGANPSGPDPAAAARLLLARLCRFQRRAAEAGAWLDLADERLRLAPDRETRRRVIRERASLAADAGDHATAYRLFQGFHEAYVRDLSHESEARGQLLQTLFETEQARTESRELRQLAYHDALTGLPNRRRVEDVMPGLLEEARRSGTTVAVGILDLDGFKHVNDTLTHQVGDELLTRIGAVLDACRERWPGALVARLGGDEFVVAVPSVLFHEASAIGETVVSAIRAADLSGIIGDLPLRASMGLVVGNRPLRDMLTWADHQLIRAKQAGKDQVQLRRI